MYTRKSRAGHSNNAHSSVSMSSSTKGVQSRTRLVDCNLGWRGPIISESELAKLGTEVELLRVGYTCLYPYALLCFALLCFALLCFALLCFALLCFALLCFALLCFALPCFALLCLALPCFALLYFALLCFALLCFALLCFALLCFALLCFASSCHVILCSSWLHQSSQVPLAPHHLL